MPKMTGARLFAEMMRGYEASHIFFVPVFMLKALAEMEVNFARVAEEFGCGIRVTHPGELADAIQKAIGMGRPVVVDVVSDIYAIAPLPWTSTGRAFHSYQKS